MAMPRRTDLMPERRPVRNAERPRFEHLGVLQTSELSVDQEQNVLNEILGVFSSDDAGHISQQRRPNGAQQRVERLTVAELRSQHEQRFIGRRRHPASLTL